MAFIDCLAGLLAGRLPHKGVNDGLKALLGGGVVKGEITHALAIQCTFGGNEVSPKLGFDGRHGGAAGIGQMTGNRIRIKDHRTYVAQHSGDGAFSAADAAGQADQEGSPHARSTVLPHAKWIAGRTPWRSARRQRERGRKERSRLRAGR